MKESSVRVAVLLLAALGIGWLLSRRGRDPAAEAPVTVARAPAPAPTPAKGADDVSGRAQESARVELELGRPDGPSPAPAEPEGIAIRVVRAATGELMPGIEVRVLDRGRLDVEGLLLAQIADDDARLLGRYGRRLATDGRGIARCPRPSAGDSELAVAEHDGLSGAVELFDGSPDEVELALAPDPAVRVRVVTAARAATAGVDVVLRARTGSERRELARATTAPDGLAALRGWHARLYAEDEVDVGLDLLASAPVEAPVEREAPPREPIELLLPDAGRVEVELERADGAPLGPGFVVRLARPREPGRLGGESFWARRPGWTQHRIAKGGRAVFEVVEVGLALALSATGPGFPATAIGVAGPTAPGETVTVRLPLGEPTPVVVGRLVGAAGEPVASTSLGAHLISRRAESSGSDYDEIATDGDGVFRYTLPTGRERPLRFELALLLEQDDGRRLSASVELPGDLPAGETHVGTLVLAGAPVLVAGIVVDDEDRPVSGASVWCKERIFWDEARTDIGWTALLDAQGRTGRDGRFDVRARSTGPEVFVDVRHEDYLALEDFETRAGRADLRLVLRRHGSVAGRLLFDEGVSGEGIQLLLRSPAIPPGESPSLPSAPGEFLLGGLPAGTYTLECRFWPERRELARIEGIEVVAGRTTRDSRLDPIDLRGHAAVPLSVFRIRVLDPDGRALPAFGVARRLPGASEYGPHGWSRPGETTLEITTASPALDLHVRAIGKRSVELLGVDGDREVLLGPGIPVRVVLAGERPALPANASVVLSLRPEGQRAGVVANHEVTLDAAGGADLLVGDPGTHLLQVVVQIPGAGGWRSTAWIRGGDELRVEVRDAKEAQVVTRTLGTEAWRAALRELGIETE